MFMIKKIDQTAKDVVLAVMILLKENPDFLQAKRIMVLKNFIYKLRDMDKKTIETEILSELKKYIVKLTFEPEW